MKKYSIFFIFLLALSPLQGCSVLNGFLNPKTEHSLGMLPEDARLHFVGGINFENEENGVYTAEKVKKKWNLRKKNGEKFNDLKGIVHNRATITENKAFNGKALKIYLPKGKIWPTDTGAQIFSNIGEYDEVYYGLAIMLPEGFE